MQVSVARKALECLNGQRGYIRLKVASGAISQMFQKLFRCDQIGGVESFGKSGIHRGESVVRLSGAVLVAEVSSKRRTRSQLP